QGLNVQLLGISPQNPFDQRLYGDSLQLPYPLLSDLDLKVAKAYGVLYGSTDAKVYFPEQEGKVPGRAFFLVDKQGMVRGKWIGEDLGIFPTHVLLQGAQDVAQKP